MTSTFSATVTLARRAIRLYFTDTVSMLLSLVGAMIAILLVLLFLKSNIVDSMVADFHGLASRAEATQVLDAWLVPSACVIASATTALGALRQFVDDRETARWRDFLVTPVPRWTITLGYLIAAALVSMLMTTVIFVLGTVYCWVQGVPLNAVGVVEAWAWLLLSCFGFTGLMGVIVSLVKTMAAFGGASTIVGVLFGFLSETYVTASALPTGFSNALHTLPFAQASAVARSLFAGSAVDALPAPLREGTRTSMGITIDVGSASVGTPLVAGVLVVLAVIGSLIAWQVMARTVRHA